MAASATGQTSIVLASMSTYYLNTENALNQSIYCYVLTYNNNGFLTNMIPSGLVLCSDGFQELVLRVI